MHRLEDAEMPAVDGQYRRDIQPLGHRDYASVNEINVLVVVFTEDLGGTLKIIRSRILQYQVRVGKVFEKIRRYVISEAF